MKLLIFISLLNFAFLKLLFKKKRSASQSSKHLRTEQFLSDNNNAPQIEKYTFSFLLPEIWPLASKDSGYITLQEFKAKLWNHALTPGEIQQIYRAADRDKNLKLTPAEWREFYYLFVKPYENCLKHNYSYTLFENELRGCLIEKYFKSIYKELWKSNSTKRIWTFMNKREGNEFNFFDYIFIRRVNVAWELCISLDKVAVYDLPCALHITSPGRKMETGEAKQIYDVGLSMNYANNSIRGFLDLFTFIDIATIYMYYSEFDKPIMNGKLSKADLTRGVLSQILPIDLTVEVINDLFSYIDPHHSEIDEITFNEFCVFIHLWRLFYRFGVKNPKTIYMKYDNFYELLGSNSIYEGIIAEMNAVETPNKTVYEEFKNESSKGQLTNEKLFLVEFLEKSSSKKSRRHDLRRHFSALKTQSKLNFTLKSDTQTSYHNIYCSFGEVLLFRRKRY